MNGRPETWRLAGYLGALGAIGLVSVWYRTGKKRTLSVETAPRRWKLRSLLAHGVAVGFLLFAVLFLRADPVKNLTVTMLDVGQGDSLLIETPGGSRFLVDGGRAGAGGLAEYTLEPVLLSKGIDRLDAVFLSHADADHVNGVEELLERGKIGADALILPDYEACEEDFSGIFALAETCGIPCRRWSAGDVLEAEGVRISCLHPVDGGSYPDTNGASLVLLLSYGSFDMLFTGDIGEKGEREILTEAGTRAEDWGASGAVEVLKTAHHGSRYSSCAEWLSALRPRAALISCGEDNSYGHPHQETLKRLKEAGSDCYQTPVSGALTVETDGTSFFISEFLNET